MNNTFENTQKNTILHNLNLQGVQSTVVPLSMEDFKSKYGAGYRLYTPDLIKGAIDDLNDNLNKGLGTQDDVDNMIKDINACERVYVSNNGKTNLILAKAMCIDEIEKAEKNEIFKTPDGEAE